MMSTVPAPKGDAFAAPPASSQSHRSHGPAIRVVIPRSAAWADTTPTTPGHGHINIAVPRPLDTPGHGHTDIRIPRPLDTPGHGHIDVRIPTPLDTPGHGHANVSLFSLASPRGDSPSTPTHPRPSARASRRTSMFSSASQVWEHDPQSHGAPGLESHPEEHESSGDHSEADIDDDEFHQSDSRHFEPDVRGRDESGGLFGAA
ncbi:hypothetical protein BD414DRAFT_495044 [Trametes punicea]|nr:hypothetical protein BD414DRAFT_495044 [Trametes punicea]